MAVLTDEAIKKALARKRRLSSAPSPIILLPSFIQQNEFINDSGRFIAAQCGRRSGKTSALALRFARTMDKYPKSQCVYLALTRDSARDIMWPVLLEMNEKFNLGYVFMDSKLIVKHPNGAKLRLIGADMPNFAKRLKGIKAPGLAIDEAQDFGAHLQYLINDVLTPTMADYTDSWLALTGTPGPVPQGYFFEVTSNRKYGFNVHKWTVLDNPYVPNPAMFIEEIKRKNEWQDNNPTLLREWRNMWVKDTESLWIRYSDDLNHYTEMPKGKYTYILGIDVGFKDADAIAVLAWSDESPVTYLVREVITPKQDITALVEQINALSQTYPVAKMIIDAGGLGKKLAEELRRRHGIPVEDADKTKKQENVAFLNDALRRSKLMAKSASKFAQDSYLIQIDWDKSTPDRIVIRKNYHSDIIDAVLYAFKLSPAYSYVQPVIAPVFGTAEWNKAQEDQMFESAKAFYEEQEEEKRRNSGFGWGTD